VCSAAVCQRERHRRAGKQWREREAPAERQHRLRQRIRAGEQGPGVGLGARLAWDAVRDAVGLEVTVVIEEMLRVLEDTVRDAVRRQVPGISRRHRFERRLTIKAGLPPTERRAGVGARYRCRWHRPSAAPPFVSIGLVGGWVLHGSRVSPA
jgi:hypothetical protein